MRAIKEFLSQHKHFYSLLLLLPLLAWFKYLELTIKPRYIMHTKLDDMIPFLKIFAIPYVLWFAYVAYGLIYTGLHSRRDYYRLFTFLSCGMSISYILYMIFPNTQNLRPVIRQNDPLSLLVKFLYWSDTPTNVCPSIHMINTVAVDSALKNSSDFCSKKYGRALSSILAILICLSTVFIKQHSVIDVACGFAIGIMLYIPIYGIPEIRESIRNNKDNAVKDNGI